ncbi:MAG: DNA-protecting protein DprA [Comamonadaceae bacterium]|nr:MAG: DNA-protecting protein DprA [Comamonadaceae bacterium]
MEREELAGWLRLALTPGAGNEACRKLLATFGLPSSIFTQTAEALRQVAGPALTRALGAEPEGFAAQLALTWQWLQDAPAGQRRVMTLCDSDYPPSLLAMNDPPPMLYLMGAIHLAPDPLRSIAIVGSRNPTPQGEVNAREFGKALAAAGLTVVSGLALGVDGAAHSGALEGAGDSAGRLSTIAVIGTGLDRVYPKRHLELARSIVHSGLIISEFPLGTPPLDHNFPRRNRIIAALAQGTLVVEAALKSGSLITARMAVEQGRDVFAIPGSIHSTQSRGCHALIRQGAKLVESAQDVLEELRIPFTPVSKPAKPDVAGDEAPETGATPDGGNVVLERLGFDPVSLDALVARTGMAPADLLAQLLELELDGQVARLPGGVYQRMAMA